MTDWRYDTDEAMQELCLPPLLDEPNIVGTWHDTWTVEDWRNLEKRERGPVFQANGFPWYISLPMSPVLMALTPRSSLQAHPTISTRQQC